jgi:hypothetical protein
MQWRPSAGRRQRRAQLLLLRSVDEAVAPFRRLQWRWR